jgi:hypothetical protein
VKRGEQQIFLNFIEYHSRYSVLRDILHLERPQTFMSGIKLARVGILRKCGNRFDLIEVKSKSVNGSMKPRAVLFRFTAQIAR